MPNNIVVGLAKKSGKSEEEVEKLWDQAKKIAKKEYPDVEVDSDKYWKLCTGITKKSLGMTEETTSGDVAQVVPPMDLEPDANYGGCPCFDVDDKNFWKIHNKEVRDKGQHYKTWSGNSPKVTHFARNNPSSPFLIRNTSNGMLRKIKP
jgi:hypothetical protein